MSSVFSSIKNYFHDIFYEDNPNDYNFSLGEQTNPLVTNASTTFSKNSEALNLDNESLTDTSNDKIFPSLDVNLEYIRVRFNEMINSDIIIREFTLTARNKQYSAFLVYIDGMTDQDVMNNFILKPLMLKNTANSFEGNQNRVLSEVKTNNITVRKVKKFNIVEYISNCLLPQNNVKEFTKFDDIVKAINAGDCALFIDTLDIAFDVEVKGYERRSLTTPHNEMVIRGAQVGFTENLRTNTSLLRKIVNNENLIIENIPVGNISKTKCGVCYMKNIANSDLVGEVKFRLSNLSIDSLLSTGQLEQLLDEEETFGVPQLISTERPDKCCKYLFQGRVIILVNGNPYALIAPATIEDFLFSPEDTNLKPIFTNFLRAIRLIAGIITLLLPGLYIAVTSFHQEILPTELLFSILSARENVPFPMIFELLLMEFSFELIREAGLRVPSPIGSTIGIVGALILGDAAVNAGIVSPILIIVVAITGISSFAIPDFSFGFHLRVFRFIFIALGFTAGFLGIGIGLFIYLTLLCSLKSFGVPYTSPITPSYSDNNGYFIPPIWKQEFRDSFLSPKRKKSQAKISMKWKY